VVFDNIYDDILVIWNQQFLTHPQQSILPLSALLLAHVEERCDDPLIRPARHPIFAKIFVAGWVTRGLLDGPQLQLDLGFFALVFGLVLGTLSPFLVFGQQCSEYVGFIRIIANLMLSGC